MEKKITLTKEDWIKGAFRALTDGGEQAIRIEAIAREMKVSKGSFYWHFKDLASLKESMLEHWAKLATFDIIANLSGSNITPVEQLKQIIILLNSENTKEYGGPKSEGAIQNWALHDEKAAKVFKKVETARLQFLIELFTKINAKNSTQNAKIFYANLIGSEHLSAQGSTDMQENMLALLEMLVLRP